MENIISAEFFSRINHVNIGAQKGHFDGGSDATGTRPDDETFFASGASCSFFKRMSSEARGKIYSIFGFWNQFIEELDTFPIFDGFPKLISY